MRTLFLILIAICINGCESKNHIPKQCHSKNKVSMHIEEVCIEGVVYLVFQGHNVGGMTPKINAEFYPYVCVNKN